MSEIKSRYKVCRLGDICKDIFAGGDVPTERYSKTKNDKYNIPIYANAEKDNGLYGYTDIARVNEPCITIAARGTIGFTAIRTEPFLPVVRLIVIIPKKDVVDLEYLYFALYNIVPRSDGTSIPQLTIPAAKNLIISFPLDISIQKALVVKLKKQLLAIDAMAEKTKRQLQYTISLAARINKETIVFEGKKEPISKYCVEDKRIIQPDSDDAQSLKYLGMENIDKNTWVYIASSDIIEAGSSTTYYYDKSHVLYGKLRPYLKKVFLPEQAGRCSTELIPLLPSDTIEHEYLALLLTDDDLVGYIMSESTGARMPRTDMKKLLAYKVSVPNIEEQRTRLETRKKQMKKSNILIEKLHKQQENIDALRACVFKEAFGSEEI